MTTWVGLTTKTTSLNLGHNRGSNKVHKPLNLKREQRSHLTHEGENMHTLKQLNMCGKPTNHRRE